MRRVVSFLCEQKGLFIRLPLQGKGHLNLGADHQVARQVFLNFLKSLRGGDLKHA